MDTLWLLVTNLRRSIVRSPHLRLIFNLEMPLTSLVLALTGSPTILQWSDLSPGIPPWWFGILFSRWCLLFRCSTLLLRRTPVGYAVGHLAPFRQLSFACADPSCTAPRIRATCALQTGSAPSRCHSKGRSLKSDFAQQRVAVLPRQYLFLEAACLCLCLTLGHVMYSLRDLRLVRYR